MMLRGIKQGTGIFIGFGLSALFAFTVSGTIKTWTTGETLTATDLNTTVQSLKTAVENANQFGENSLSFGFSVPTYQYARFSASGMMNSEIPTTMTRSGSVRNFTAKISANTIDVSCSIVLRKNATDSAISQTVSAGSTANVADADAVAFVASDTLLWRLNCPGATVGTINAYIQFDF